MKLNIAADDKILDDAQLVEMVLGGDRDAFGQLVARYQSPICAMVYSACGNVSHSEDLAQETFIIAWRKLSDLKEPAKFKSWLYGIARNLINNAFRQQIRNPLATAELLDESLTTTATSSNPIGQAISKEEEKILWCALEHIPEVYREPLVLFYREHQSIEQVAKILDLSEETTRQRLSRGRKLLHEQVIAFVEGALARTNPGQVFTLGVMAALPAMAISAKAATLSTAAKGGAIAKASISLGLFGAILTPAFAFFGMFVDYRLRKRAGLSGQMLKILKIHYLMVAISVILFVSLATLLMDRGAAIIKTSPTLFVVAMLGLIVGYPLLVVAFVRRLVRAMKEASAQPSVAENPSFRPVWEYRSRAQLLGLPLIHIRFGARMGSAQWQYVKGWIAITDGCAFGGLFAYGGVAVAPLSVGACSIGLLAYGAAAIGGVAWGGFSFGVWAFGAFTFGWEAFSGGCAIAWHLAWGYQYAIAHDYALGAGTVHALQANTPFVEKLVKSSWGHDFAVALTPWFYWLMWVWAIPIMFLMMNNMFRIAARKKISAEKNS